MGVFNFKSVGQTLQSVQQRTTSSAPPVGIKTPLEIGSSEGIFAMHFSTADQVHDNLRNLLLTNWGERLVHYNLGANLRQLTTEFVSQEDFDTAATTNIKNTVATWMPFVELESFLSTIDRAHNKNTAVVVITITYNVPALNVRARQLEIVLYVV